MLVGFMGAGKTSVGRALASRLGLPFFDADEQIEGAEGMSVARIFETRGEPGFRAIESEVVQRLLEGEPAVIAVGGGAVESGSNRDLLGDATVVYLELDAQEALRRIGDPSSRPMLRLHDPAELLARRRPLYEGLADLSVSVAGRSVEDVVDEVLSRLPTKESSSP